MGSFSCLLVVSAISAAMDCPIQSYCPPTQAAYFLSEPLSRVVRGRGVTHRKNPKFTLMWTTTHVPANQKDFRPNHFVLMKQKRNTCGDCDVGDLSSDDVALASSSDEGVVSSDAMGEDDREGGGDDDRLPLPNNEFMEAGELMNIFMNSKEAIDKVPIGEKNNVFFKVKNEENMQRRASGKISQFWDDRGAWKGGSTTKTVYVQEGDNLRLVIYKNMYNIKKKKNGVVSHVPLDPQPSIDNVVTLHRYYAKHGSGQQYERRVSWLSGGTNAIYEYKGVCPTLKPHCYIRMHPKAMVQLKEKVKVNKPSDIIYSAGNIFNGPRNRKQIYNAKARSKGGGEERLHSANFADEVAAVEELQHSLPFVRLIIRESKKVPSIILYNEEQITDIKRFCCPPLSGHSTTLGLDKTYNLGNVHVTVTCYKCLSVHRQRTEDFPVFCGPMFIHGNSDKDTFFLFLQHLAGKLSTCGQTPVGLLGSDEETALRQAMLLAFPNSPRLVCAQHLEKNVKHALADKIGMNKKERCQILEKLFSPSGVIAKCSNHVEVDDYMRSLIQCADDDNVKTLLTRVSKILIENAKALDRPGLKMTNCLWTNNNSGSVNHVLKQAFSWKSMKLVDLVQKLHMLVASQYREIQRALCGMGELKLVDEYRKFLVPRDD